MNAGVRKILDKAVATPGCAHGCPLCPHPAGGPALAGAMKVKINGLAPLRTGDKGIHMIPPIGVLVCCDGNNWEPTKGSMTVKIEGKPAVRLGDTTKHCGGVGSMVGPGALNVNIGG